MSDLRDDLLLTLCQPSCGLRIDWEHPCPQHARQAESLEAVVQKRAEQLAQRWEEVAPSSISRICADELRSVFGLATREESNQ